MLKKMDKRRLYKIYVCSPYKADTLSSVVDNVNKVSNYCKYIITTLPHALPVATHIYLPNFLDDQIAEERKLALDIGRMLVGECDELWVFGERVSDGMAAEISEAARRGLPIRWFTTDCKERKPVFDLEVTE